MDNNTDRVRFNYSGARSPPVGTDTPENRTDVLPIVIFRGAGRRVIRPRQFALYRLLAFFHMMASFPQPGPV